MTLHSIPKPFDLCEKALALRAVVTRKRFELLQDLFLTRSQIYGRFHLKLDEHIAHPAATLTVATTSALAPSSNPLATPAHAVAAAARAASAFDTAAVASARRLRLPGLLHQQRADDALPR